MIVVFQWKTGFKNYAAHSHTNTFLQLGCIFLFIHFFTDDSENDLKINIFLAAVDSDVGLDAGADTDVVFKDPAQEKRNHITKFNF